MVYAPFLFEEDPSDEFLAEKQEINRLYRENQFDSARYESLLFLKIQELMTKEAAIYGEKYADFEAVFAFFRLNSMYFNIEFTERLQSESLENFREKLINEKFLKELDDTFHQALKDLKMPFGAPELYFSMDRKFAKLCKDVLGEESPVTLKRKIELIQDYSVLGDSKVALEMSKDLLSKVEAAFGAESSPTLAENLFELIKLRQATPFMMITIWTF